MAERERERARAVSVSANAHTLFAHRKKKQTTIQLSNTTYICCRSSVEFIAFYVWESVRRVCFFFRSLSLLFPLSLFCSFLLLLFINKAKETHGSSFHFRLKCTRLWKWLCIRVLWMSKDLYKALAAKCTYIICIISKDRERKRELLTLNNSGDSLWIEIWFVKPHKTPAWSCRQKYTAIF